MVVSQRQVKIAFAAPLTGDQSIVGVPMRRCVELAIAQVNETGEASFLYVLQAEDDRADPDMARETARRLVADSTVVGVVGHKNSGPSAAAAPIYDDAGLVQITPSSTNPTLSRRGYRTFFRLCAHDEVQGAVAARYAVRVLGAERVVVIHDTTAYGEPLADVVRDTLTEEGAEVVLFEGVVEGAGTYPETVKRVQSLSPDLVYFALTEIESSILARELRVAGVEATLFGTDGSRESKFLPLAGDAAEGAYQTYAGVDPESAPAAQAFVEAYEARYGPVPVYGVEVYDAARLLIDAASRAGSLDREKILRAVADTSKFAGASGTISFDANGDRRDPQVSIWQVRGGEMQLVGLARDLIPDGR